MKNIISCLMACICFSIGAKAQQAPIIKVNGSTTGPRSFHFEAGTTICFNFTAYESDTSSGDTTILEWNRGISSATFSKTNSDSVALVQSDEGVFCWTPSGTYGCKTHYFMVYARYKNKPEIRPSQVVISLTIWTHPTFIDHIIPKGNGTYVFVPQIIDGCGIRYNDTSGVQYFWSMPVSPSTRETWGSVPTIWYDSVRILTHTFPKNGTYFYKQWISEPFKGAHNVFRLDSIHVTDALETGIESTEPKSEFNVWPVPARNKLNINGNKSIAELKLIDVHGRELLTKKVNEAVPLIELDISQTPRGFYFLHIKTTQGNFQIKKIMID